MAEHSKVHSTLGPSAAERWIACPASVQLIETLDRTDDGGSVWAAEGTRAHNLAEIEAAHHFGMTGIKEYRAFKAAWLRIAEKHEDDVEEMERHVRVYVSLLADIKADMGRGATVHLEQQLQTGVPDCWGTGDAVVVSPKTIRVVDFKYGQGVPVYAENNPQLRLYGLGALELFDGVLGDAETVGMTICQPRVGSITHEYLPAEDLRWWRENIVLPAATETRSPDAQFHPSEIACRWCPAAGICVAREKSVLESDFGDPTVLDVDELAAAWRRLPEIRDWCSAIEAEALHQAYSEGNPLPGLKVVLSGGKRNIPDPAAAIKVLLEAGFPAPLVSRPSLKTLSDLERVVGKHRLPEVLGDLLVKSQGRPALVDEKDSRQAINPVSMAALEFQAEDESA